MALPLGRPTVRTLWCGGPARDPGWLPAGSFLDRIQDVVALRGAPWEANFVGWSIKVQEKMQVFLMCHIWVSYSLKETTHYQKVLKEFFQLN